MMACLYSLLKTINNGVANFGSLSSVLGNEEKREYPCNFFHLNPALIIHTKID